MDASSIAKPLRSINPATGALLREFAPHDEAELDRRLSLARQSFHTYRRLPFAERARLLLAAAGLLEAGKQEFGRLMSLEMGKPLKAAVQEIEKCAAGCRFYAENAAQLLANETVNTGAGRSFVTYQPIGPVLAIMPWNFPFWQVFRFAAPALMAGNVALLKHASNVPQCALAIERVFHQAGFPEGVFQSLLIGSGATARVIEDSRIVAVTLTGSVAAGASVAALAAKQIKKTVLELGGSDPFIVMPSADLSRAVKTAVQARTINNGQSCIAAKRFIIHRQIADAFQEQFVAAMSQLKLGDPLAHDTDIGPLATSGVLEGLQAQVDQTVHMGARVLLGGRRLPGPGWFFPPTVLTDIPPGSPAHNDELFGPVASLFPADSIEHAMQIANDTPFGLGATVWTNDRREQDLFVAYIESGLAFINGMVASDPRLPFGGVKQSGYGRELSRHGILEFVNAKTVVYQDADPSAKTE